MIVIKAIRTGNSVAPATTIPTPNFGTISYGMAYLVLTTQEEADLLFSPVDNSTDVDVTPVTP